MILSNYIYYVMGYIDKIQIICLNRNIIIIIIIYWNIEILLCNNSEECNTDEYKTI